MCTQLRLSTRVRDYVSNHGSILEPAFIAIFLKESEFEVILYVLLEISGKACAFVTKTLVDFEIYVFIN